MSEAILTKLNSLPGGLIPGGGRRTEQPGEPSTSILCKEVGKGWDTGDEGKANSEILFVVGLIQPTSLHLLPRRSWSSLYVCVCGGGRGRDRNLMDKEGYKFLSEGSSGSLVP